MKTKNAWKLTKLFAFATAAILLGMAWFGYHQAKVMYKKDMQSENVR